jgi:protein gp37
MTRKQQKARQKIMADSSIEWTDATWNPTTGCDLTSPGCDNCYAKKMSTRLKAMGQPKYQNEFKLTLHPDTLAAPLGWRKPRRVFVNSMSDLFHKGVPLEFIKQVFDTMRRADWHTFQILTKRSRRLAQLAGELDWPPNVWMGVSVEDARYKFRIDDLRTAPAALRFVSFEPLIGDVGKVDLSGIGWAIAGAESGAAAAVRPMDEAWVRSLKNQCVAQGVKFFYKQNAANGRKRPLPELDGRQWVEVPD